MTLNEATALLKERFVQLNRQAEASEESAELTMLCDSAHKLYITLVNAGGFDDFPKADTGGLLN